MRALALVLGLIVVAAAIAGFAPASLVAAYLAAATRGEALLADARGTVWNGTGDLATAGGRWSLPVTWTLEPLALLRGEARLALRSPGGGTADVVVRDGIVVVRDVVLELPAQALRLPAGTTAGGTVRLTSPAATLGGERQEGSVRVEWQRARLAMPGAVPVDLGTAIATLTGDGTRWRGPLQARGGQLDVDGEANVDRSGADVSLALVPRSGAPDALRALLGPPDAQGTVRWRVTPRFR
jgi:general secretion pathway protein N